MIRNLFYKPDKYHLVRDYLDEEVINDYSMAKYGHTNWAWTDTLDEEDQTRMSELGEIEVNIVFYFKEVNDDIG